MAILGGRRTAIPVDLSTAVGWSAEYRTEAAGAVTWLRREQPATRWALLADTHVPADPNTRYLSFRPHECARDAVDQITDRRFDGTIINGDIAWLEGLPEDYVAASELLGPLAEIGPLITTPGNHDDRENLCAVFSDPRIDEGAAKVMTVVDSGPVLLVGLDSLDQASGISGRLDKLQLDCLNRWLATNVSKPVILFVHHPVDDDEDGLLDSDALLKVADKHGQIKAIFTAHDHVFSHRKHNGVLVVTQPAVGFAFEETEMHGWLEAELSASGMVLTTRPLTDAEPTTMEFKWLR